MENRQEGSGKYPVFDELAENLRANVGRENEFNQEVADALDIVRNFATEVLGASRELSPEERTMLYEHSFLLLKRALPSDIVMPYTRQTSFELDRVSEEDEPLYEVELKNAFNNQFDEELLELRGGKSDLEKELNKLIEDPNSSSVSLENSDEIEVSADEEEIRNRADQSREWIENRAAEAEEKMKTMLISNHDRGVKNWTISTAESNRIDHAHIYAALAQSEEVKQLLYERLDKYVLRWVEAFTKIQGFSFGNDDLKRASTEEARQHMLIVRDYWLLQIVREAIEEGETELAAKWLKACSSPEVTEELCQILGVRFT